MPESDSPATRRGFLLGILALGLPVRAKPALALTEHEQYVSRIANDVIKLANGGSTGNALRAKFNSLLGKHTDVRSVALFALGKYRPKLPPNLKDEYFKLVLNYISALFVYYVDEFRGSGLAIKETREQGSQLIVMSDVTFKSGKRAPVRWRLVPAGSRYRVNDVNIKGIWLSVSMKQRFTDILAKSKGDFDPLFAELRSAESWNP